MDADWAISADLEDAITEKNLRQGIPYQLSVSYGCGIREASDSLVVDVKRIYDVRNDADQSMYAYKERLKNPHRNK